ncbi:MULTISPECIES: ATP-binding protein [Serratia]|uniref:ATP-binding protein n=1 Tax=Serratia TaxID=613 RepID=UPI0013143FF7|nr:ATP-binding protein [Serratia marcescens]
MMASSTDVMARLLALKPAHVEPRFTTVEGWKKFQAEEALKSNQQITDRNRQARMEKIIGRSGIQPMHRECSFSNYRVECPEQQAALDAAKGFVTAFGKSHGGFVFSGNCGTGKNHLASAIARNLIKRGYSAMVMTVSELFENHRATFSKDSPVKEADLLRDLCRLDLLVLDEVGLQKGSDYETNLLTNIVDRRQLQLKPTGMLTNKTFEEMVGMVGERVMDRQTDGGIWVPFTWASMRGRKGKNS